MITISPRTVIKTTETTIPTTTPTTTTTFESTKEPPDECYGHRKNRGIGVYFGIILKGYDNKKKTKRFSFDDAPFCICTHLIYAYHRVSGNGTVETIHDIDPDTGESKNPLIHRYTTYIFHV